MASVVRAIETLRKPTVWALIAANVMPLLGVLLLSWRVGEIVLLYWLESAIVGGFTVLKMALARDAKAFFLVPFFCLHFGTFMAAHLVFVLAIFFGGDLDAVWTLLPVVALASLGLVASHGYSFVENYLRGGERRKLTINALMSAPYPRVIVTHVTILVGAFLALATSAHVGAILVMVVLKTVVDVIAHRREHARIAEKPATQGAVQASSGIR